jgi:catechol 2,3-dioxygenase-like lactoylglutathione lyase family enzyme
VRLACVVTDARDRHALAQWWSRALGWPVVDDDEDDVYAVVEPPPGEPGLQLVFQSVPPGERAGVRPNRVHLDLRSRTLQEQEDLVTTFEAAGARRVDIGQGDVPWVVLADPEGNEFCVLEPREEYALGGQLAAVVVQAVDPSSLEAFWAEAIEPQPAQGPRLEFVPGPPHTTKNRVHLDVRPGDGEDQQASVERLLALGARPADVGQGDVTWTVLADPEGNEFCVLRPPA